MGKDAAAQSRGGALRRSARALAILPVLMAASLAFTIGSGYRNAERLHRTLARGQGELFLRHLAGELLRGEEGPAGLERAAESLLAAERGAGLQCIALGDPRAETVVVRGACSVPDEALAQAMRDGQRGLRDGLSGSVVETGHRVRMMAHVPPPGRRPLAPRPPPLGPGGEGPGPDGEGLGPGGEDDDRPPPPRGPRGVDSPGNRRPPGRFPRPGPPPPQPRPGAPAHPLPVLIEFEPLETRALDAAAARTLAIGSAASLALLVFSLVLWRVLTRAEHERERLDRDRRLASLGEMSAVLAHEIRNPLASMKGHAQLLAEGLAGGTPAREKADRIVRDAVRLEELTNDLLSFVRSQQVERAMTSPAAVLREAVSQLDSDRVDVTADGAPASWPLDAHKIGQVLGNLLRNALAASPPEARVTATAGREGALLVFTVRDHGPGVPPAEIERIFEPFHTTRVRGTGLGLALARRIAHRHGGTITVTNHRDGGALFRVALPRGPAAPREA